MQLHEFMRMLAYHPDNVDEDELILYDATPYGQKRVKVNVGGTLYPLKDMHLQVTDMDIIIEIDSARGSNGAG